MATTTRESAQAAGRDERDPVLDARLAVPRVSRLAVDRPRLTALLDRAADLPLTLVSAPAGSGKTALVADWAAQRADAHPIGWVTFEAGDERPGILWPLVVASLRRCGVPLPAGMLPGSADPADRQALAVIGAALAEGDDPLTLVLDGYEVADADLAAGMEFLLAHSGGRLRLVLLTRADPLLPLHRFRLAETMTEIRMADLAFTEPETAELLRRSGVALTEDSVCALVERTRGWAAGIRFAAMALERCEAPDEAVTELTGDSGNVAEYLMTEILQALPSDVREVLLRTSVVDVLRPGLIEALGGRSAARTLAALAHANVLVEELAGPLGWYAYHPYLRELLRAELACSVPARLARLQRRAARWYAANGLTDDAVAMAASSGAWTDAATYAVEGLAIGRIVLGDDSAGLVSALAAMPDTAGGQPVAVVRAALALAADDPERCAVELVRARERTAAPPDPASEVAVESAIDVVEAARSCAVAPVRRLVVPVPRTPPTGKRPEVPPDGQVIEALTAKEQEVLGHLAELLSTEEIAATMFVSVNTVRTHVRNILRKLAVPRRNDAVRRARALSLIA